MYDKTHYNIVISLQLIKKKCDLALYLPLGCFVLGKTAVVSNFSSCVSSIYVMTVMVALRFLSST